MILLVPLLGTPSEKSGGSDSSLVRDQRGLISSHPQSTVPRTLVFGNCFNFPAHRDFFLWCYGHASTGLTRWLTNSYTISLTALEPNPMGLAPVFLVTTKTLHIAKFQMLFQLMLTSNVFNKEHYHLRHLVSFSKTTFKVFSLVSHHVTRPNAHALLVVALRQPQSHRAPFLYYGYLS